MAGAGKTVAASGDGRREQIAQGVLGGPSQVSVPTNILRQVSDAIKVAEPGHPGLQIMLHEVVDSVIGLLNYSIYDLISLAVSKVSIKQIDICFASPS